MTFVDDLQVVQTTAPTRTRSGEAGRKSLDISALHSSLAYVGEDSWFSIPSVPSATKANALIYAIRRYVDDNGNGLEVAVESPDGVSAGDLLALAREEKAGGDDTPITLAFHVKATKREYNRKSATDNGTSDSESEPAPEYASL